MIATIPSPTQGVWEIGPVPLRAYALCILLGIVVAIWISRRRWAARGGDPIVVLDVATWAVPFGVIGGRLYHVITSPEAYFGADGDPVRAFFIWEGGLGIWGAVILGGVGAWIGCRQAGIKLPAFGDAIAPGILVAQAIGRVGNWFNNELYGRATDLPWGLQVHEWDSSAGRAVTTADGQAVVLGTFHPAFLYEALWNLGAAALLVLIDRRLKLGHGRVFALYVMLYCTGRFWIELLRVDPAEEFFGIRLNVFTCLVGFVGAALYLVISAKFRPGRETEVRRTVSSDPAVPGSPGEPDVPGTTTGAPAPGADEDVGAVPSEQASGKHSE